MKTIYLQPRPGWIFLFFVVLGPPIGAIFFTLAAAGIGAFSPMMLLAAVLSYTIGAWPAVGAALLFWSACFLYRRMYEAQGIDLKAGAVLGFLSGLISMSVFVAVLLPLESGTYGRSVGGIIFGALVPAICGVLSIRFSK